MELIKELELLNEVAEARQLIAERFGRHAAAKRAGKLADWAFLELGALYAAQQEAEYAAKLGR